jgi:hypothetical protein
MAEQQPSQQREQLFVAIGRAAKRGDLTTNLLRWSPCSQVTLRRSQLGARPDVDACRKHLDGGLLNYVSRREREVLLRRSGLASVMHLVHMQSIRYVTRRFRLSDEHRNKNRSRISSFLS